MFEKIVGFSNITDFVSTVGAVGVFLVVFAESGLFFGFFLPGDSLLFTAGVLSALSVIPFWFLCVGVPLAAILGDSFGYLFGKKVGSALYEKRESRFFKKDHVYKARYFYDAHGPKALILARFIPIVRTFVPIVAGIAGMEYKKFLAYNVIGGVLWSESLLLLGFTLGTTVKDVDKYLLPIILCIVVISFLPIVFELFKKSK